MTMADPNSQGHMSTSSVSGEGKWTIHLLDSFIRAVAFSYNSNILLNTIPLDEQADIDVEAVVPI